MGVIFLIIIFIFPLPVAGEYSQARIFTPFGELLIALPSEVPVGLFGENSRGKLCWENEEYQALKCHENNVDYYLILNKRVSIIYALIKITPDSINRYWLYSKGKPVPASKEQFEALLGLPTPCYHPLENEL